MGADLERTAIMRLQEAANMSERFYKAPLIVTTCAGCGSVVTEDWVNGQKCFRCYEPGQTCGYIVGIERFLPYVPAWCPKMGGCLRPPERYEVQKT